MMNQQLINRHSRVVNLWFYALVQLKRRVQVSFGQSGKAWGFGYLVVFVLFGIPFASTVRGDKPDSSAKNMPQVEFDPSILEAVNDKTLGIPPEESAAYYQLLHSIRYGDANKKIEESRQFWAKRQKSHPELSAFTHPHFADIFKNPKEYRGKLVTQVGIVRRIIKFKATSNEFDISNLYEAWLYPEEGQSNPIVVVFTVPPRSPLKLGNDLSYRVGVTGYFFKLYGYRAQDTTRLAPMVLAGALEDMPSRVEPTIIRKRIIFFASIVCGVLILMLFIVFNGMKNKKTIAQTSLPEKLPELPGAESKDIPPIE